MAGRSDIIIDKKKRLLEYLKGLGSLAVGFSGGVDSTLLLAVSHIALGDRVIAMTAKSVTHPRGELDGATQIAKKLGVQHIFFHTDEMQDINFISNGPQRCYYCKKRLFLSMRHNADQFGIENLAHGANIDDLSDHRPGHRAAEEMGVLAPLCRIGFNKMEIRQLAKQMGLSNWNQPAMACLATRVPYGTPIKEDLLHQIDRAEEVVRQAGISHCRVRHHGSLARIEIDLTEKKIIMDDTVRKKIISELKMIGYKFISVDLEGFVSGKMNREL